MTNPKAETASRPSRFTSSRAVKILSKLFDDLALIFFVALVVVATTQVLFRYVLVLPLPWTEELARFLLVWVTFLGAASITRRKMHIRVDYFSARFSLRLQTILRMVIYLLIFLFLIILFFGIIVMMIDSWPVHAGTMPWLSMSFVYLGAGIGVALMICIVLDQLASAAANVIRKNWS
jgi:TRAP-type C4-dicarboxylate transport system permease small subunit